MRFISKVMFLFAAVGLPLSPRVVDTFVREDMRDDRSWLESEESRQTFKLDAGSKVELLQTLGEIEIEPTPGEVVEVAIFRSAKNKSDLSYYKIKVEQTPSGLSLRGEGNYGSDESRIDLRQRISIKLPSRINLSVNINTGPVRVGAVDGNIRLSGISGPVQLAETAGYSDISGVSGPVLITLSRLNQRGMDIQGISGIVQLRFTEGINADLSVNGITGTVSAETPNIHLEKIGRVNYRAKIGSGGTPVSISGVSGIVTVAIK